MTINEFQKQSEAKLQKSGINSANLDVLILLEDALNQDRAWILAHPESPLCGQTLQKLNKQISHREKHEPLAYIRGKTEFYRRDYYVNKYVLEPRPESETMITLLVPILRHEVNCTEDGSLRVVDVGTGSGALAITTKLEMPVIDVVAIDVDPNCLKIARKNAKNHNVNIEFLRGDLLSPLSTTHYPLHSILANLPYVPNDYTINQAAATEPSIAIFGGPDGLDIYRRLFEQLSGQNKPKYVLTESFPLQHAKMSKIARKAGYKLTKTDDFIQVFKSID
jgi:release factor glutamine methyltransferase